MEFTPNGLLVGNWSCTTRSSFAAKLRPDRDQHLGRRPGVLPPVHPRAVQVGQVHPLHRHRLVPRGLDRVWVPVVRSVEKNSASRTQRHPRPTRTCPSRPWTPGAPGRRTCTGSRRTRRRPCAWPPGRPRCPDVVALVERGAPETPENVMDRDRHRRILPHRCGCHAPLGQLQVSRHSS